MRVAILFGLVLLSGCAAAPPSVEQLTVAASDVDLCEAFLYSRPHDAVRAEVMRRNLNCHDYVAAIQARQQLRQQATQASGAAPSIPRATFQPAAPKTTTCTSTRVGTQVQTICN